MHLSNVPLGEITAQIHDRRPSVRSCWNNSYGASDNEANDAKRFECCSAGLLSYDVGNWSIVRRCCSSNRCVQIVELR